jgi:hypothetical protein
MKDINGKIEFLRRELEVVLRDKGTTDDPEVVSASEMLDEVLNDYHKSEKRKAKIRKHRLKQLLEISDYREK